jgi:dTDP-4-dehydrorhamnose reductase
MPNNTKIVLVTGALGQLGNELRFLSINYPRCVFVFTDKEELDITVLTAVEEFFEQLQPQYCVNVAAYTAVDKAETDIENCLLLNATAVENLAKTAAKFNTKFIHVSTDFVFDGTQNYAYTEESSTNPLNQYGKAKLAGELAALRYSPEALIIRTSWLYSTFGANFVKTMLKLAEQRSEINVVADQIGTPTYAKDLAELILKVIDEEKHIKGVYHFSNEGICTWYDFAHAIFSLASKNTKVKPIKTEQYPTPAIRPKFSLLDKTKIKQDLAIDIRHWREALAECVKILR